MKIGDKVMTPDGKGTIEGYDLPESDSKRYIVKLDGRYDLKCYFPKEVEKV